RAPAAPGQPAAHRPPPRPAAAPAPAPIKYPRPPGPALGNGARLSPGAAGRDRREPAARVRGDRASALAGLGQPAADPLISWRDVIASSGAVKIATFNVNGVNGRLPVLLRWLADAKPDIVCLQE